MWDSIFPYVAGLLPTVVVATLFYFLMKHILEADRRERMAQAKWEREHPHDAGGGSAPEKPGADSS